MNGAVLQATGLNKSYGKNHVLRDLDLAVEPGKIYGLIGRNGAGKTTLLGILTGQNTHESGTVTYGGARVWENRKVLGELCFSRELSETMLGGRNSLKVRHYLDAAALFLPHWDEAYARRLLEAFSLDPRKKIYALSKGQRSLVTVLIGLASRAPVTILDEPAAGLDVVMRERFYQLLLEDFGETGRTFLLSTHIIEEAASVFEDVLFLDRGKIVEQGPVDELVSQFHLVSGREDDVDRVCRGLEVLSTETLGRHKTAAVRCGGEALWAAQTADVDISPMNLQRVFVTLCGHEPAAV